MQRQHKMILSWASQPFPTSCYFIWLLIPTFINMVFCSSGAPSATAWMYLEDLPVLKTFPTTSQTLNMYATVQIEKCAARHLD